MEGLILGAICLYHTFCLYMGGMERVNTHTVHCLHYCSPHIMYMP